MPNPHCPKCGSFRSPVPPVTGLFDSALPFPSIDDPFARFHRESREREAKAVRRGVCREVGAERRRRVEFTIQALKAATQ